jgi:TolB-like protein/tetratricopeptide (TPR) repeat protein
VLWTSDTFVDFEVGLNSAVRKLREALDDSAENPRFVQTLPRRGYRFVAPVSEHGEEPVTTFAPVPLAAEPLRLAPEPSSEQPPEPVIDSARVVPAHPFLSRSQTAAMLFGILLAGALVMNVRGGLTPSSAGPAVVPIRFIIVLPFANLTGDPGQEYFVDSVTDGVTAHLAQVAGLDVISGTTARQYKNTAKRPPEIGKDLAIDGVVEGSVARSGSGVTITTRLIRAATDLNVQTRIHEAAVSDMLKVLADVSSDIAAAAGRSRAVAARTPQTIDPKAYDAYVKGVTARGQQRHDAFRRAAGYFEEAIAIQPDFAEAHASLANVQVQFLYGGPFAPRETMPKAEAAARKALQLDPANAQAHRALGQVLMLYHWRWEEGEKEYQIAAGIQGGHADAGQQGVESLIRRRRFAEAVQAAEYARRLDPLSVNAQVTVGVAYRAAGQHERALNEFRHALEMSPANNRVQFQRGITLVALGRLDEAIGELEQASRPAQGHNSRIEAYLGYAYAAAGRTREARAVLQELELHRRDQYVSWFGIAVIHDTLGEKEAALAALQRAFEDRAVEFGQTHYPPFRTIASEPAFQTVTRQVGLAR